MTRGERLMTMVLMVLMLAMLVFTSILLRTAVIIEHEQQTELANQAEGKRFRAVLTNRMDVLDRNTVKIDTLLSRSAPTTRP